MFFIKRIIGKPFKKPNKKLKGKSTEEIERFLLQKYLSLFKSSDQLREFLIPYLHCLPMDAKQHIRSFRVNEFLRAYANYKAANILQPLARSFFTANCLQMPLSPVTPRSQNSEQTNSTEISTNDYDDAISEEEAAIQIIRTMGM